MATRKKTAKKRQSKKKTVRRRPQRPSDDNTSDLPRTPRELVVLAKAQASLRATPSGIESASGANVSALSRLASEEGIELRPLFGMSEERMASRVENVAANTADAVLRMPDFYHVEAPEDQLDELASKLLATDVVDAAYVKPPAELAVDAEVLNDMTPRVDAAPAATPDFTPRQIYLNAAPDGIDARYAWTLPGGRGQGVRIIDLEWGWNFGHEDLVSNQGGVVAGTNSSNDNHGTAVLGEYSGDRNDFGVTGICSEATASAVAFSMPTATAIRMAADRLRAGDIMLLEIHRAGPNATGVGQFGYIAVEWWPDDFAAIRYAINRRNHRRGSCRQRQPELRRCGLRHQAGRFPGHLAEPAESRQSELAGCRRGRRCSPTRRSQRQQRSGPITTRVLQLRPESRLPGMGT